MKTSVFGIVAILMTAACGGGGGESSGAGATGGGGGSPLPATQQGTEFISPTFNFDRNEIDGIKGNFVGFYTDSKRDGLKNGVVYGAGIRGGQLIVAAGLVDGTRVFGGDIVSGQFVYKGSFNGSKYSTSATRVNQNQNFKGDLNLSVNASNGSGRIFNTPGTNNDLTVNATFDRLGDVTGTVSFEGAPGQIDGLIGRSSVIGAFVGGDNTIIYSGGFVVE